MSFNQPTENEIIITKKIYDELLNDQSEDNQKLFKNYTNFNLTTVLRFYRGRKCNEEVTLKAIRRHLQWRTENDVDNINNKINLFQKEFNSGNYKYINIIVS